MLSFSATCSLTLSIFVSFAKLFRTACSANLGETIDLSLPSLVRLLAVSEKIPSLIVIEIDGEPDGVSLAAIRPKVGVRVECGVDLKPPVLGSIEDVGRAIAFSFGSCLKRFFFSSSG